MWRPRRKGIRSTRGHRLHVEDKPRWNRIVLNHDALHRRFWRQSDDRHRVSIHVRNLSVELGVSHEVAGPTVNAMVEEGRLRQVAWDGSPMRVFQVADPEEWRARDTKTHAVRATTPKWG